MSNTNYFVYTYKKGNYLHLVAFTNCLGIFEFVTNICLSDTHILMELQIFVSNQVFHGPKIQVIVNRHRFLSQKS